MYRLIIDMEMGSDLAEAQQKSEAILKIIKGTFTPTDFTEMTFAQYKLVQDGSRSGANHLNIVDGRAMGKKLNLF